MEIAIIAADTMPLTGSGDGAATNGCGFDFYYSYALPTTAISHQKVGASKKDFCLNYRHSLKLNYVAFDGHAGTESASGYGHNFVNNFLSPYTSSSGIWKAEYTSANFN